MPLHGRNGNGKGHPRLPRRQCENARINEILPDCGRALGISKSSKKCAERVCLAKRTAIAHDSFGIAYTQHKLGPHLVSVAIVSLLNTDWSSSLQTGSSAIDKRVWYAISLPHVDLHLLNTSIFDNKLDLQDIIMLRRASII